MIVVRRTYTPQPGGGGLVERLREVGKATVEAGFPPIAVYRRVLGPHGTLGHRAAVAVRRGVRRVAGPGPRYGRDHGDIRPHLPAAGVDPRNRDIRRRRLTARPARSAPSRQ